MFSLQMSQVNIHVHPYIHTNRQTDKDKKRTDTAMQLS